MCCINWKKSDIHLPWSGHMATILHQLLDSEADSTVVDHLVREAAQGHTQAVAHLLEKQPDKVRGRPSQGHSDRSAGASDL